MPDDDKPSHTRGSGDAPDGDSPADAADEAGRKPATVTGLCAADKFFNIGCNGSIPHGFLIALRTVQLNYIGTTLV